jgi:hypothetical protein
MLLEISVPVYRRDRWGCLEKDGRIQVSSEVDTLSSGPVSDVTAIPSFESEF